LNDVVGVKRKVRGIAPGERIEHRLAKAEEYCSGNGALPAKNPIGPLRKAK
jgi:hypothetical protein